jgi:hypothetical protein
MITYKTLILVYRCIIIIYKQFLDLEDNKQELPKWLRSSILQEGIFLEQ